MGQARSSTAPPLLTPQQRHAVLGGDPTLESIASLIASGRVQSIVTVVGAGVSTSAGIPDFRTPGTGLYSNLARFCLPAPEAVFDINFFRHNPRPFFALARELYPGQFSPTLAHCFLRLLHEKQLLRRVYTQNIDTLERVAGIPPQVLVEAHGSFATSTCLGCGRRYDQAWMEAVLFPGATTPPAVAHDAGSDDAVIVPHCDLCGGVVKPDITFFGEELPSLFHSRLGGDVAAADLLLVMGTSLQVYPVAVIPSRVREQCPRLLINREVVGALPATAPDISIAQAPAPAATAPGAATAPDAVYPPPEDTLEGVGAGGTEGGQTGKNDDSDAVGGGRRAPAGTEGEDLFDDDDEEDGEGEEDDEEEDDILGGRSGHPAFRFGRRDNYRDVLLQCDADEGVTRLVRAIDAAVAAAAESAAPGVTPAPHASWEAELGRIFKEVQRKGRHRAGVVEPQTIPAAWEGVSPSPGLADIVHVPIAGGLGSPGPAAAASSRQTSLPGATESCMSPPFLRAPASSPSEGVGGLGAAGGSTEEEGAAGLIEPSAAAAAAATEQQRFATAVDAAGVSVLLSALRDLDLEGDPAARGGAQS